MIIQNDDALPKEGKNIEDLSDEGLDNEFKKDKEGEDDDTILESSTKKVSEGEEPTHQGEEEGKDDLSKKIGEDKNPPFHEHPRWKQLMKEREEDRSTITTLQTQIQGLQKPDASAKPVPKWFSDLYGDNKEAWDIYNSHQEEEKKQWKKELMDDLKTQETFQQKEQGKWNDWVKTETQRLVDEGKKFNKNELYQLILKYKPTDDNGNLDFDVGYELYEKLHPASDKKPDPKEVKRKEVAGITTIQDKGQASKKDGLSFKDLRFRSMSSLATEDD